ncbi:hypothetical protein WA026_001507 [Henosepilachna vigintioctopunctata]
MKWATLFQILLLLSAYLLTVAYGLKCFQCNSYDSPDCLTLTNNDTHSVHYKECPKEIHGNTTFCRKLYQQLENDDDTERVKRSCGWITHKEKKDLCWRADTDFKMERVCQCFGDACNTSTRSRFIYEQLVIAGIVFLIFV